MPKVSQAHLDARRQGILRAARRCFGRRGLEATTVRDICRAANLSPGAVYRYFPSKRSIVQELARGQVERIEEFLSAVAPAHPDPTALGAAVAELIAGLDLPAAGEGLRVDLLLWGGAVSDPELAAILRQAGRRLHARLAGLAPHGSGAAATGAETLGQLALALFQGLALQKVLDPERALAESAGAAAELFDDAQSR